jgi:hypothetical protein
LKCVVSVTPCLDSNNIFLKTHLVETGERRDLDNFPKGWNLWLASASRLPCPHAATLAPQTES